MSVYTTVTQQQLTTFLQSYNIGELIQFSGISAGMENTNYSVTTSQGEFILTLYEHYQPHELDYFFKLMVHLSSQKIKTLSPIYNKAGIILGELSNKPAALIHKITGTALNPEKVTIAHCQIMGKALAQFHIAGLSFEHTRPHQREKEFSPELTQKLSPHLSHEERQLLNEELSLYQAISWEKLPMGVIHSDLFCDNTIFYEKQNSPVLMGIIDLYLSAYDALIYDLAIVVNDWCCDAEGTLDKTRWIPLLSAYHAIRPLTDAEKSEWIAMLRITNLRFWLSRLDNKYFPPSGDLVKQKDPNELMNKIIACQRDSTTIIQQLNQLLAVPTHTVDRMT